MHSIISIPLLAGDIQQKINRLFAALYPINSGYWGPAFNETEKTPEDFITAWGHDAADPTSTIEGTPENRPTLRLP